MKENIKDQIQDYLSLRNAKSGAIVGAAYGIVLSVAGAVYLLTTEFEKFKETPAEMTLETVLSGGVITLSFVGSW